MYEEEVKEFGVSYNWHNAIIKDSIITHRGTKVEMIERPNWGIACYMDNSIQSAEIDEKIYHEALVHPIMSNDVKKVLIIGGGEGATAREVLKWPVEEVDMIEWDKDVVELFRTKYPQWAKGAWDDPRLTIEHSDIFKKTISKKYDVIIIDLFEPDNVKQMSSLLKKLHNCITLNGSIVMYAGMRNILVKQPYQKLIEEFQETWRGIPIQESKIIPYKVYIPSFSGESMFLLINKKNFEWTRSHITNDIWNSYKTFNW